MLTLGRHLARKREETRMFGRVSGLLVATVKTNKLPGWLPNELTRTTATK